MKLTIVASTLFINQLHVSNRGSVPTLFALQKVITAAKKFGVTVCCSTEMLRLLESVMGFLAHIVDTKGLEGAASKTYPGFDVILLVDTEHTAKKKGPLSVLPPEFDFFHRILGRMVFLGSETPLDDELVNLRECARLHSVVLGAQFKHCKHKTLMESSVFES